MSRADLSRNPSKRLTRTVGCLLFQRERQFATRIVVNAKLQESNAELSMGEVLDGPHAGETFPVVVAILDTNGPQKLEGRLLMVPALGQRHAGRVAVEPVWRGGTGSRWAGPEEEERGEQQRARRLRPGLCARARDRAPRADGAGHGARVAQRGDLDAGDNEEGLGAAAAVGIKGRAIPVHSGERRGLSPRPPSRHV